MKISTRGRYAVMAMADMTQQLAQAHNGPIRLADISKRQEISFAYLEQIFGDLRRAGLVVSHRGAHGGYRLAMNAEDIRIGDVIDAVDETVDVTRCRAAGGCLNNHARCLTHDLWDRLGNHIHGFLNAISLADVVSGEGLPIFAETPVLQKGLAE